LRRWRNTAIAVAASAVVASTLTAPAAFAAPTVVAKDAFERTVTSGWGTATSGGTYTGSQSAGVMSVGSGVGRFILGPSESGSMLLGTGTATDVRTDVSLRLDKQSGGAFYAVILRRQADGSHYRARLNLSSSGVPTLALSRVNGGTEVDVASKTLTTTPLTVGGWYTLSFSLTGTSPVTIQASLAKAGTTAAPQLVATDSSASRITAGGRYGWWGYGSGKATGDTALSLDNLTYTNGASPLSTTTTAPVAPAPTPTASVTPTPTPTTSPTPTPTPTTPPVTSTTRGSAAVGTTAYAIPAGSLYVSNTTTASTQNGALATPYKSVQAAVNAAKAGATIVVRKGTYNESVDIPFGKNVTIQAYPNEEVWFDGSIPVTNWTASGTVWIASNWTAQFASDMGGQASRFVNTAYPTANKPDQLFIDGVAQKQVASASQVTAGTFAVDYANKRLILGTNPSGKAVRASNIGQAFNVMASNTTLQGFGVRRYATTYGQSAAVRMQNTFATVRNLVITDNAFVGLSINNNDSRVERVTSQRNGILGIGANAAYRLVLRDSIATHNNVEKFKDAPVAGGIKITRSRDVTVHNVDSSSNTGAGLWFDESTYDMKVTKVVSNYNTTTGIQLEISAKAVLAGNQTIGGGTGVIIMNTSDVRIFNSDFGGGTNNGVSLKQDARRPATASTGWDPRMGKADPTMTWVTKNITVANNVFGAPNDLSVRALDGSTNRAVDTWNLVVNGNLFNNKAAGGPTMVGWGLGDNKTVVAYNTPTDLAAAKNSTWKNAMVSTKKTLAEMKTDAAANAGIAVAVPTDIATLLGWTAGSKRLGSGM
jgi:hypothetical protein